MVDLNHIKNILDISNLSNEFGRYSKIYMMTTENIKGFLEQCYLVDRDVVTVAGSGDQMLNAYLMGARNVTCFDINPFAFYQVNLKKTAISVLSYEQFLKFFFPEFGHFLEKDIFDQFSTYLDSDTNSFFQYLYHSYSPEEIFQKIYYRFQPSLKKMQRMNSYLDPDNYLKLSAILQEKNISFIQSDVTYLKEKLDSTYDLILLSNISDSIQDIWPSNSLKNFKSLVHSLSKKLNNDGIIQVGYIYDYYFNRSYQIFRDKRLRQSVFTTDEFHTTFVESYRFHSESDAIITFQKTKRIG